MRKVVAAGLIALTACSAPSEVVITCNAVVESKEYCFINDYGGKVCLDDGEQTVVICYDSNGNITSRKVSR